MELGLLFCFRRSESRVKPLAGNTCGGERGGGAGLRRVRGAVWLSH